MPPNPACARRLRAAVAAAVPPLRALWAPDSARAPSPGKWSPRQIIGHLIDSATNNHQRFVRGALQEDLVFPGYAQEQWVALQRYQEAAWSDLVLLWSSYNRHIATVMAAIPAHDRDRVRARHNLQEIALNPPARAPDATLDYFMSDYVVHLEMHLRQILGADWTPGEPA